MSAPLAVHEFPRAIIHIDGDAFFASCEQSRNPALRGKPVITGKERGIVSSMSYEAKTMGVKRAMRLSEVKAVCPNAIFLPSDYETYSLLSRRFFSIVHRYTSEVEESSIDECFADITGLRRPLKMNYHRIVEHIKDDLDRELGFTFSIGLGPNKVIAKLASKWNKPSGITVIPGYDIHKYLDKLSTIDIWGIGPQTSAFLSKEGVHTALQFAQKSDAWVKDKLTKPFLEIWQELHGQYVYKLNAGQKDNYASIQKVKTFTPPSDNRNFIFSQLSKNIESACIKARRYKLSAQRVGFFLRTSDFVDKGIELKLSHPTAIPGDLIKLLEKNFDTLYKKNTLYRSTGVVLNNLTEAVSKQLDIFGETLAVAEMTELYKTIDEINARYGKHKIYLGTSSIANTFSQHAGDRGDLPSRREKLLKGENERKRLGIPMFLGNVN